MIMEKLPDGTIKLYGRYDEEMRQLGYKLKHIQLDEIPYFIYEKETNND